MSNHTTLRNDNYVFISGAGFSVPRGLPTLAQFAIRMRDAAIWCETHGRSDEALAIADVLNFRLRAASAAYRIDLDLENIEHLFSLAAASDEVFTQISTSLAATLHFCLQTRAEPNAYFAFDACADLRPYGTNEGGNTGKLPLYDAITIRILRKANPTNCAIISFNYDDVIEQSLRRLGVDFDYCTAADATKCKGHKANSLPLLKLHGSTNWALDSQQRTVHYSSYEEVRTAGLTPNLIPPTWAKYPQGAQFEVWKAAVRALERATKIIIVGFSMPPTDLHFRYLLAAGIRENISLRQIIFVDPSPAIPTRAAEMFSRRELLNDRVRFKQVPIESLIASARGDTGHYQLHDGIQTAYFPD